MRSLRLLAAKEFNALLAAPAFWLLLFCVSFLTGYSFIEATRLFAEASRSALQSPELAKGLSPLDGVLVPTWGGLYLASTLLYPFLAIQFISLEKESGSLKLSLQFPVPLGRVVAAKILALAAGWGLALTIPVSAVLAWALKGGHVGVWELANLALGHALYACAVTGTAMLAASLCDSTAAAALLSLAVVLGGWALDFAGATQTGWAREAAALSFTGCLHSFEKGLWSSPQSAVLLLMALVGTASGTACLRTGETRERKAGKAALIAAGGVLLAVLFAWFPISRDASEDRRNSFNPADERALSHLDKPLNLRVFLNPEDSRLWDLERSILSKLKRTVPRLRIELRSSGSALGGSGDDQYGLLVFEYGGKTDRTRSTSEEELLPLVYALAGEKAPTASASDYPGHPLVADFGAAGIWFYAALPALIAGSWRRWGRRIS